MGGPDDPDRERARLAWRCRRGMRELELLLLGFLEKGYDALGAEERRAFERLLGYPDPLLLEWLMGRAVPAEGDMAHVVHKIRAAARA